MTQRRRKPVTRTKAKKKPATRSKGRKKSGGKGRGNIFLLSFAAVVIALIAIGIWNPMLYVNTYDYIMRYYRYATVEENTTFESTSPQPVIRTEENYGAEIDKLAAQFDLSPEFLKSLIILECSGLKNVKPRFERHIYKRLVNVREKKLDRLENITYADLKDATDDALKNMAKSWGPFQIMGYKCIWLDIQLKDLRGHDALYWAVKWVDLTYGDYIRKGLYKDAFHIHNTGRPYPDSGPPKTYDPKYVQNGLMYMKYFEDFEKKKATDPNYLGALY
jgi:hypothetical protein